jgi:hypothetical protein
MLRIENSEFNLQTSELFRASQFGLQSCQRAGRASAIQSEYSTYKWECKYTDYAVLVRPQVPSPTGRPFSFGLDTNRICLSRRMEKFREPRQRTDLLFGSVCATGETQRWGIPAAKPFRRTQVEVRHQIRRLPPLLLLASHYCRMDPHDPLGGRIVGLGENLTMQVCPPAQKHDRAGFPIQRIA